MSTDGRLQRLDRHAFDDEVRPLLEADDDTVRAALDRLIPPATRTSGSNEFLEDCTVDELRMTFAIERCGRPEDPTLDLGRWGDFHKLEEFIGEEHPDGVPEAEYERRRALAQELVSIQEDALSIGEENVLCVLDRARLVAVVEGASLLDSTWSDERTDRPDDGVEHFDQVMAWLRESLRSEGVLVAIGFDANSRIERLEPPPEWAIEARDELQKRGLPTWNDLTSGPSFLWWRPGDHEYLFHVTVSERGVNRRSTDDALHDDTTCPMCSAARLVFERSPWKGEANSAPLVRDDHPAFLCCECRSPFESASLEVAPYEGPSVGCPSCGSFQPGTVRRLRDRLGRWILLGVVVAVAAALLIGLMASGIESGNGLIRQQLVAAAWLVGLSGAAALVTRGLFLRQYDPNARAMERVSRGPVGRALSDEEFARRSEGRT